MINAFPLFKGVRGILYIFNLALIFLISTTLLPAQDQIQVYFNYPVAETYSNGQLPDGQSVNAMINALYERIDNAQSTIDVAMYNTNYYFLIDRLEAAQNRGVHVRYIYGQESSNSALSPAPNFPILKSRGDGRMHNKFFIIDAADAENSWTIQGSCNMTFQSIEDDFNNLVMIQHQDLAQAYLTEFEEMWGGSGANPNIGNARFGAAKTNNTPHEFTINGNKVQSFFSPSDRTSNEIYKSLNSANATIDFATFAFTYYELGSAIIEAKERNVKVRGIIEQVDDSYSQFERLQNKGVNVTDHPPVQVVHHKYAIVDAASSDPQVISGSHNWSFSAETANDENTLIFHDAILANLFIQDFEARWRQVVNIEEVTRHPELDVSIFPNPTSNVLHIGGHLAKAETLYFAIYDATGCLLLYKNFGQQSGDYSKTINVEALPKGQYYLIGNGKWSADFQKN